MLTLDGRKQAGFLSRQFMLSCLFTSVFVCGGCKDGGIFGTDSGKTVSISGTIQAQYHSDLAPLLPLAGATLTIDTSSVMADGTGRYEFNSVTQGKHKIRISAPGIVPIDTLIDVTGSTSPLNFQFLFYRFGGTVSIDNPTAYGQLIPLKTTVVLDGAFSFQTTGDLHNFDCGFLAAGTHTLHIDATQTTLSRDTTFVSNLTYDFGTTNDYRFYVKGIPREFKFPADVGTTWQYDYQYGYYDQPGYVSRVTQGTHIWTLASTSITGSHIRAFLTDIRNDTTTIHYTDGYRADSSYTSVDTVSFSVFTSDSSIGLSSPEWSDALPRYYNSGGDTLVVSPYLGGIPEQLKTMWVNGVGLISVNYSYGGHVSTSTTLTLREFTKP